MRMRPHMPPEWHAQAKCAVVRQPQMWDYPLTGTGLSRGERLAHAMRLCDGCPVVALCAAEGLERRDQGVVRAGIPIPDTKHREDIRHARAVLGAIAGGERPARAALDVYGVLPRYAAALDTLVELDTPSPARTTPSRGDTPPNTPYDHPRGGA